jgi:hypothetical protein
LFEKRQIGKRLSELASDDLKEPFMFHFASLGGVLHLVIQMAGGVLSMAGGVLSNISHHLHTMVDTPILTKH